MQRLITPFLKSQSGDVSPHFKAYRKLRMSWMASGKS